MPEVLCAWCGHAVLRNQARIDRASIHFCSPKCHKRRRCVLSKFKTPLIAMKKKVIACKAAADNAWKFAIKRIANGEKKTNEWLDKIRSIVNSSTHNVLPNRSVSRRAKSDARLQQMRNMKSSGMTNRQIGEVYGIEKRSVKAALKCRKNKTPSWDSVFEKASSAHKGGNEWLHKFNGMASNHRKRMRRKEYITMRRLHHQD